MFRPGFPFWLPVSRYFRPSSQVLILLEAPMFSTVVFGSAKRQLVCAGEIQNRQRLIHSSRNGCWEDVAEFSTVIIHPDGCNYAQLSGRWAGSPNASTLAGDPRHWECPCLLGKPVSATRLLRRGPADVVEPGMRPSVQGLGATGGSSGGNFGSHLESSAGAPDLGAFISPSASAGGRDPCFFAAIPNLVHDVPHRLSEVE